MGLKLVTGSCYIGGFIEYGAVQATYLGEKILGWEGVVQTFAWVAHQHP